MIVLCPRCSLDTLVPRRQGLQNRTRTPGGDQACSSPTCNWPDPEPGLIGGLRLRHGQHADRILAGMRACGAWPPIP